MSRFWAAPIEDDTEWFDEDSGWYEDDDYTDADAEPMPDFGLWHDPMDDAPSAAEPWQRFPDYSLGGLDVWLGDDQMAPDDTAFMEHM